MEAIARVSYTTEDGEKAEEEYHLSELEVVRIVAAAAGFHDMDLEPDVGCLRLTVTGNGMKVSVRGSSRRDVAVKLMRALK